MSHTWRKSQLNINISKMTFPSMPGTVSKNELGGWRCKTEPVPLILKSLCFETVSIPNTI